MSTELYQKVYDFLANSPLEHITASSVIFQLIEEEPWITKEESRTIVNNAINASLNIYSNDTPAQNKLLRILVQFDDAFEGVCSLRDIGAVKLSKEKPISSERIIANYTELKSKLTSIVQKKPSPLYKRLLKDLDSVSVSNLSWKSPLASQVISDEWDKIRKLPKNLYNDFMKPARRMAPSSIPSEVRDVCRNFVSKHSEFHMEVVPDLLSHDGDWKDSNEVLSEVTIGILNTLNDSWENPAFGSEFVGSLNEGTYVTNVIVPAIRATLKNLPFGKSSFISTSERQSTASADRKGKGQLGRRPDIMFVIKFGDRVFELMYTECSRLICSEKKKNDDKIKLWREANDGMYWVRKGRKPNIDEFGIISLQVAGDILHLNVLIRDEGNFHRYCRLRSVKIPVQLEDSDVVSKFVEALLIMRNIIIVNISQLYHAPISRSERRMEDSSTVDSE